MICLVFSIQSLIFRIRLQNFIGDRHIFCVFALLFLQTVGRKKCEKDYASIWRPMAKYREMEGRRCAYYHTSGKFAMAQVACFDRNEQKMKRFSRFALRRDDMWTFAVSLRPRYHSLRYVYWNRLSEIIGLLRERSFLLEKFSREKKQLIRRSPFSLLTLIKAYLEFKYKRSFAQLFSSLQLHLLTFFF